MLTGLEFALWERPVAMFGSVNAQELRLATMFAQQDDTRGTYCRVRTGHQG
jgi:hypothetical protein